MNKDSLKRFINRVNQYAQTVAGQSFSLYLTKNGERKVFIQNYLVKKDESIRKSINPILAGQDYQKLEIIFRDGRKYTPFALVDAEAKEEKSANNAFELGNLGLGLAGISPEVQQQGLGAIIAAVTQKQVEEKFQAQDLLRKNELIDAQKTEIEKLNEKIQELIQKLEEKDLEITEVRQMKQSFSLKGFDVTEFAGLALEKLIKNNPSILMGLGVPEERVKEIFPSNAPEVKQIEEAKTEDHDQDGAAVPISNDEKIRTNALQKFTDYVKKLSNPEFKVVMEINLDLQTFSLDKKLLVQDLIKSEIPQNNG